MALKLGGGPSPAPLVELARKQKVAYTIIGAGVVLLIVPLLNSLALDCPKVLLWCWKKLDGTVIIAAEAVLKAQ